MYSYLHQLTQPIQLKLDFDFGDMLLLLLDTECGHTVLPLDYQADKYWFVINQQNLAFLGNDGQKLPAVDLHRG
jgi:hypothetical protein